jgi:rhodanese-related sulfurtransferase
MNVVRDLTGGFLVIVAAGVVAIAQNAARDDGIPLIPKAAEIVSGNPYTPESPSADNPNATAGRESVGGRSEPRAGLSSTVLTGQELASGVVSKDRLSELLAAGSIVLIDARLPGEYGAGHIEGAINIPYEKLPEYYEKLTATVPLDAAIVCYCRSVTCDDSENLVRELKFTGYNNVVLFKGGWDEWSQAADPRTGPPSQE